MLPSLYNNEKIVSQSAGGAVILTTDRILYEYQIDGRSCHEAIMLEQLTSCENHFSSSITLLALAGISLIIGILGVLTQVFSLSGMLVLSVLLLLFYVPSRRNVLVIASGKDKVEVTASAGERDGIEDFLNEVEAVKSERVEGLNDIEVVIG